MKIVNPSLPQNNIYYISRFNIDSTATTANTVTIYNPQDKSYTDITSGITMSGYGGISYITIPQSAYTFIEDAKVKITISNNIIQNTLFIGDILPTTQPTSSYKSSTNKYEYK
jgi:hypothetical protein